MRSAQQLTLEPGSEVTTGHKEAQTKVGHTGKSVRATCVVTLDEHQVKGWVCELGRLVTQTFAGNQGLKRLSPALHNAASGDRIQKVSWSKQSIRDCNVKLFDLASFGC